MISLVMLQRFTLSNLTDETTTLFVRVYAREFFFYSLFGLNLLLFGEGIFAFLEDENTA